MTDEPSRVMQANEKTKALSTIATNFGTALTASAFGRLWLVGLDHWVILWSIGGFFMIRGGIDALGYLEAES